jgi:DNA-binding ferritin-like protein (Dps family)
MNAQQMIDAARMSGGRFACLHEYESSTDTIATYYLRLGVTRAHALNASLDWVEEDKVDAEALADATGIDKYTCAAALDEQTSSWRESLEKMQRADNFETVATAPSGRRIFSLRTDKEGNTLPDKGLYLTAMRVGSVVHVQGESRPGPKSDKAIVKDYIRRKAPIGSFRTYNLRADNFKSFTFGKDTLTPADITSVVVSLTA